MRITNQMRTETAVRHMNENMEKLGRLQQKVSGGKQFEFASDDPVAASMSLSLRSSLNSIQSYKDTATAATDWLTATEFAFQQMEDIATRAINLVTRGLNDTMSAEERASSLGAEMGSMVNHAMEAANSQLNGQYLFAGYQINQPAFRMPDANTIVYDGDSGNMQRNLGPGHSVSINVQGDQAFQDFMETLVTARNALQTNDTATLRTTLTDLKNALNTVDSFRTSVGARMRQVTTANEYLGKAEIEAKSMLSKKEDINLAEGISMLRNQETAYQAVLEVSQRAISSMSLFDYLR